MKNIPKPKIGDTVERLDMSKVCGGVIKILNNKEVFVNWGDKKTSEKINNLALVARIK